MAEFYKKAIQIPTTGLSGSFIGFQNGATAQTVTIIGNSIYTSSKLTNGGISISVAPGSVVPVACTTITPASFSVLGFIQ
jgi:hypothetical protein